MSAAGAARRAEALVDHLRIPPPPVKVENVAQQLGMTIVEDELDDDISGALVTNASGAAILVNAGHPPIESGSRSRTRSLAHHVLRHQFEGGGHVHVDRGNYISLRGRRASEAVDPRRIEANWFAAALLMPSEMVEEAVEQLEVALTPASCAARAKLAAARCSSAAKPSHDPRAARDRTRRRCRRALVATTRVSSDRRLRPRCDLRPASAVLRPAGETADLEIVAWLESLEQPASDVTRRACQQDPSRAAHGGVCDEQTTRTSRHESRGEACLLDAVRPSRARHRRRAGDDRGRPQETRLRNRLFRGRVGANRSMSRVGHRKGCRFTSSLCRNRESRSHSRNDCAFDAIHPHLRLDS